MSCETVKGCKRNNKLPGRTALKRTEKRSGNKLKRQSYFARGMTSNKLWSPICGQFWEKFRAAPIFQGSPVSIQLLWSQWKLYFWRKCSRELAKVLSTTYSTDPRSKFKVHNSSHSLHFPVIAAQPSPFSVLFPRFLLSYLFNRFPFWRW